MKFLARVKDRCPGQIAMTPALPYSEDSFGLSLGRNRLGLARRGVGENREFLIRSWSSAPNTLSSFSLCRPAQAARQWIEDDTMRH